MIPLRRLFALREYPGDVMVLYAEGFSVANFLVSNSNKPTFLRFVAAGMQSGWDNAVRSYYRYSSVEDLEEAWLQHLRATKRQPPTILAQNGATEKTVDAANRTVTRQTVHPIVPQPVYRGQAASEQDDRHAGKSLRKGYLPDSIPSPNHVARPPSDAWQAPRPQGGVPGNGQHPQVRLELPKPIPAASQGWNRTIPETASPVGYPR
jgi:hypothetical protein